MLRNFFYPYFESWLGFSGSIPDAYWNVWSDEQRYMWLCKQLCKLVEYSNQQTSWIEALRNILTELQEQQPELIDKAVKARIDEMVESGEFADEIERVLEEFREEARKILTKSSEYSFTNIGRLPYRRFSESGMQGGVVTSTGICYQYSQKNHELLKFNIDSGLTINTTLVELGHCNSLSYIDSDNLVLAYGSFAEDGLEAETLTAIDGDSLEVAFQVNLPIPTEMQEVTNKTQAFGYMCAYDNVNGLLYVAGQSYVKQTDESYILKYRKSGTNQFELVEWGTLPAPLATSATDMCANDGYLYIVTSEPAQLIVFNDRFEAVSSAPVSRKVSALTYATEIESISIVGEEFIIGYIASSFKNAYGIGSYCYAKSSIAASLIEASKTTPEFTRILNVFVDNSNTRFDRDGSYENPFNNVYEAVNCAYNYERVSIIDYSPNVDNYVIAVESGQEIFMNAQNSKATYGVRMDGGYLFSWWCTSGTFPVGNNTFRMHLQNGARAVMNGWYGYQQPDTMNFEDGSVYLNQNCSLEMSGVFANINALNMQGNANKVKLNSDAFVQTVNLISATLQSTNVKTKDLEGFHATYTGSTFHQLYIPIRCSGNVRCAVNGTERYLPFTTDGQAISILLPSGDYLEWLISRSGQWGRLNQRAIPTGVELRALSIWV